MAAVVGVVLATFALIAPTLTWLEFSSGSENLNVATALEILREDRWLVPTLEGEARIAKPPLTAWITAVAIDDDTFTAMSSRDADVRARAEKQLAWQVRWPFLLSSCLMLLAAAELGRVCSDGDWCVGVVAAAAGASNLFFLRHGRLATTDVQLALWVAVANVCLAHAVMRGRWWRGAAGAGFFLGLAFMSKGPVALVQSVAPFAVFLLCDAWRSRKREATDAVKVDSPLAGADISPWGARLLQILLAISLFTLVALPWYALVASKNPDVWARWQMEVTREGATDLPPGKPYAYLSFFAFIAPWTAFLIGGIVVILRDLFPGAATAAPGGFEVVTGDSPAANRAAPRVEQGCSTRPLQCPTHHHAARGMLLALLMLIVPIVIMSFFRDRKERYLLPMIVPAGVVIARAVVEHFRTRHLGNAADRAVVAIHWATLLVIAIGLPVAGALSLKTVDGARWFSPAVATLGGVVAVAIVLAGTMAHRRGRCSAIVAATLLLMLVAQVLFIHGYRNSREGRSEMKPLAALIWQHAPDALVYTSGAKKQRAPVDLAIYLNRSVLWVDDASDIPRTAQPAVLVVRQRARESPPTPPPGMTLLGKTARDESWWHAFLRP